MARKTIQMLVDDIDGSEATQTVTFGLDGATYEIDLNDEHAAALRESMEEWVAKAHRVAGRASRRRGAAGRSSASSSENQKIRDWARENGIEVSDRGRISAEIREAYAAATK
ncbi:histone-like nucleoid-structuring protein Lsr2 [Actinomyces weissii]|uniref:Lsr2 family protein n=1 Tax=Actinomyces weissii TaxID=675090 RepID=A0A7T7M937_9ACTO|nr:Lsr2 family protein [Actinomyces weissii]QQM67181.1 Lsr2 family protein [Actinomyces weissii]